MVYRCCLLRCTFHSLPSKVTLRPEVISNHWLLTPPFTYIFLHTHVSWLLLHCSVYLLHTSCFSFNQYTVTVTIFSVHKWVQMPPLRSISPAPLSSILGFVVFLRQHLHRFAFGRQFFFILLSVQHCKSTNLLTSLLPSLSPMLRQLISLSLSLSLSTLPGYTSPSLHT